MSEGWRDPVEALAGYERWLAGLPLAERTRREYARWVRLFCGWLADGVDARAVGADPLVDRRARDYAARDFKRFLKTERTLGPASVNLALAAIDHFYRHLGLERANVRRELLPRVAPRALDREEQRLLLRAAERAESRDRALGEDSENDKNAYQALTDLGQLDSQRQIEIDGAAVVTRDVQGGVEVKTQVGDDPYSGTTTGGIIGLLVGIIGGPLGVLIGGATGVMVGSLFDIDDVENTQSVLSNISKQVQPTRTAVLAQVTEQSPEVIDTAMARLGGEVMREPVDDVEQEIAAAQEAQRKAKHEARKELQKASVEKHKEDAHAKVEELKSKLHRPKSGAAA